MPETSKTRIILATADSGLADHLGNALKKDLACLVETVANNEDILARCQDDQAPNLLIVDMDPSFAVGFSSESEPTKKAKLDGASLLKALRERRELDSIPLLAIVPSGEDKPKLRLLEEGVDDYVERSAALPIFVARAKTQLRHHLALERLSSMAFERDMFAAGVLHDIKNIETTIVATCEFTRRKLLQDPITNRSEVLSLFESLEAQAQRLGKYANEIIQSVRATKQALNIGRIEIEPILTWVAEVVGKDAGQNLKVEIPEALQPVLGDPAFLKLALLNIMQNAVRYAAESQGAKVIITQHKLDTAKNSTNVGGHHFDRHMLVTKIRDHGKGLKPTELKKIFAPFTRGSSSNSKDKGSGLGLTLVARVMSKMGGAVWAEIPTSGPGAVFCLALPAG